MSHSNLMVRKETAITSLHFATIICWKFIYRYSYIDYHNHMFHSSIISIPGIPTSEIKLDYHSNPARLSILVETASPTGWIMAGMVVLSIHWWSHISCVTFVLMFFWKISALCCRHLNIFTASSRVLIWIICFRFFDNFRSGWDKNTALELLIFLEFSFSCLCFAIKNKRIFLFIHSISFQ